MERPMPQNIEAERSILGAILINNNRLNAAVEILKAEDFFHDHHQRIYRQMIALGETQQAIDLVTLTEQLQRSNELESVGGAAYISQLMDGVPHVTNVEHYARIVKEKSLLRRLIQASHAIQQKAFDAEEAVTTIVDQVEKAIADIKTAIVTFVDWRARFHTVDELPDGDVEMLIDRFLPAGVSAFGALSGLGKTWLALSMGRALSTGRMFLGVWNVTAPVNVLYLCPEMQARAFKHRCKRFGISGERFRCMTISDGQPLDLSDPILKAAIRELHPVVFLDTAIRFANGEDENSAGEHAQGLAKTIFSLLHLGAKAVVCLHHRAKETARSEELTLENTLRGSGDVGAMCDAVYGLQYDRGDGSTAYLRESKKLVRLHLCCVKARDFCPPDDVSVQLEPYIDQIGDMAVLDEKPAESRQTDAEKVDQTISADLKASLRTIEQRLGIPKDRVKRLARQRGWIQNGKTWQKQPS